MYNYRNIDPEKCEFVDITDEADLADNERLFVEVENIRVVVFKIAGELFAIGDVCSHDDGPLGEGDLEEYDIVCPRHGARFDVRTGQVKALPAIVDIPSYPVRVAAGMIQVGLPKES